jgi:hypothetical protein
MVLIGISFSIVPSASDSVPKIVPLRQWERAYSIISM